MPYIEEEYRKYFDPEIQEIVGNLSNAGDLNYCITTLCNKYLDEVRYSELNAIIGVLECAKMEFYRRMVAPYEDIKARQNGDVYDE